MNLPTAEMWGGSFIIPNNFTYIRILGDIIGLSIIIYVILIIITFIAKFAEENLK